MKDIIRCCASRPVSVIMAIAALLTAAGFSLSRLPLDRLPEISCPRVTVETRYPGMGAEDLRSIVTIPLEDALSPVKGMERIRSVSRDGASVVVLDFRWGTDPNGASALVREAIDAVYPFLPEGIQKPLVIPGDPGEEPHAVVAVRSHTGDPAFARHLAEYELRARFRRIDGAGAVTLTGGEVPEVRFRLDIPRLISMGMEPASLARILAAETADIPAGSAREGDMELVVVSSGKPQSIEEFSGFLLPSGGGLRLSDIGEIKKESAPRKSLFIYDNREQTALEIYRRPGADPVRLSRDIRKALDEAGSLFSRDAEIFLVYDSSESITRGLRDLLLSAAAGAAAVISILIFFIRRVRYSLLTALSIPLSSAAALAALALGGKSLDGMSLGGLALGIGLVSDTAVITLDLLHRSFEEGRKRPLPEELGDCVSAVSTSSLAGTLTTAVVFIPVMFLPGPLGALFSGLSLALVSSIGAGWLYAQCGLPALYRIFYRPVSRRSRTDRAGPVYRRFLRIAVRRAGPVFLAAALTSAGGAALLLGRPAVFVSPGTAAEVEVFMLFPPGTRPEFMAAEGLMVSRVLSEIPGIAVFFGRAGTEDEDSGRRADPDYRQERLLFRCMLRNGVRGEDVLGEIRQNLEGLAPPETEIGAAYPQDRTERLLGLSSSYTLAVRGTGREELAGRVLLAKESLKAAASALGELRVRPSGTRPELRIFPRREMAALLGVSAAGMAESVYTATKGAAAGRMEIEGRPLDIRLSGGEGGEGGEFSPHTGPAAALEDLPVFMGDGGPVFLGGLGRIERHEAEAALARLDRSDAAYLDVLPVPGSEGELRRALEAAAAGTVPGLSRADESVFSRYRTSLVLTVFLVLLLLYMTMAAQFESFFLPLILMLSIPFSLAGAGPALFFSGSALDSGAALGLVVLFGLVVNNGIILYEISEEKLQAGLPPARAVYTGAQERLRPILITTLTTIFAILPLMVSPLGASQRSMSAAMLGGVIASTLLCLFALPPVFIWFLRSRRTGGAGK